MATQQIEGSAALQGALWGARARDWADVQEPISRPLFDELLRVLEIGAGTSVLDVGCGSGLFAALAATRGATAAGLDAAASFVEIAARREPRASFLVGELEELPYADDSFDIVTGFNSFQYAARPARALDEARRVARDRVAIATWGRPEDSETAGYFAALASVLPPPPPGAPGPFALSADGALEAFVSQVGLVPETAGTVDCPFAYPDLEAALRGVLSAGPAVRAIQHSGEDAVRAAVAEALVPWRSADGAVRMENTFRYLVCRTR